MCRVLGLPLIARLLDTMLLDTNDAEKLGENENQPILRLLGVASVPSPTTLRIRMSIFFLRGDG